MIKAIVALILAFSTAAFAADPTATPTATPAKPASAMTDMTLIPFEGRHLQIAHIAPKSLWEQFGFSKDDIITNYDSTQVENPSQALEILKTVETKGKHRIIIMRGQKQKVITFEIK